MTYKTLKKVKDWEYDDAMHDYMQWQNELRNLLNDEEQDKEEIERVKKL